jgi:recombination protein RecA
MKKEDETKDKKESLSSVMTRLRKTYGDDIAIVDTDPDISEIKVIPSGSFGLDSVFGCGGIPKGRMIELFGQESSGKTTLAHFLIAQVQKAGGKAALIDAEFSYDPRYTASIGVDTEKLLVIQPLHLESAMGSLRELTETNAFDIIVLDSIAAMAVKSEVEDEFLKDSMAIQARKLGAALRILAGSVARSKTVIIFINQLRDRVGIFYGSKTVTPGGKALKFFSSVRLEVAKGEKIVDKDDKQIGNFLNITGVKNKVGFPFIKTSVALYYGKGLDLRQDALDFGEICGVITKTGNTYSFGDKILGVSRDKAVKTITEDDKLFEGIKKAIQVKINKKNDVSTTTTKHKTDES